MANPTFISDQIGALGDTIALVLDGETVLTSETWSHVEGVLSQPCSWEMHLGSSDVAAGLLKRYRKGNLFELYAGGALQASGRIDAIGAQQSPGGPESVVIRGRDMLAKLHDTYVKAEVGVNVGTYAELVWTALQRVKLAPPDVAYNSNDTNVTNILRTDNGANRQIKSGVPITAILPHRTVEQILEDAGLGQPNAGTVHTIPVAKVNETWHQFIRRYIDRAGLMLWSAANGSFVLAAPNGNQTPTYRLVRQGGISNAAGNVVGYDYDDDATHRHTEAVVYGKGGGKALGRVKSKGGFVDQEMIDLGYDPQPIVFRDVNVHSPAEASYFAHRKLAEERRGGWRLEYTIAGLTLPFAGGNGGDRAVVIPDTTIEVQDDGLGIEGVFYIDTVTRSRSPQTTTRIRLTRLDDLVYGGPDGDN